LTEGFFIAKLNSKEQEVYKWIREGAELEDAGNDWMLFLAEQDM